MASGDTLQGHRKYIESGTTSIPFSPGDYGQDLLGDWWCYPPRGHMGKLDTHEVTEHVDGTITVSPSIVSEGGKTIEESWHGYLEHGVWREV